MDTYTNFRTPFWKPALGGVLAGATLYFFPFLFPLLALVLLVGLISRLIYGRHHWRMHHAMAWERMDPEQRDAMHHYRCMPFEGRPNAPKTTK
ncbi:MAG: hypothetical protein IT230_01560 [Flavobacteriales bacterium]|nr:hypothetical protein [Flavobacteriales bacterium]